MLEALRNASKSWVMKGILLLLAATFVVFFGTDFGGGQGGSSGASSVVEVGERNFTVQQVSQAFNEEIRQVSARTGQQIDQRTAIAAGLLDQAVSRLVSESLFDQAAQDLGLAASEASAANTIRSQPQFQDATGRFSRAQFENILRAQGESEAGFVNQVRVELLRNQYLGTLQSAVATPAPLRDGLYTRRSERRVAEILTVPVPEESTIAEPTEADLSAFFEEYRDAFETPELRSATIATLDPETLAGTINIPAEEIEEEYKARTNDFEVPETRDIVQATFTSEEDARRAASLIAEGAALEAAAEEVSGLPPTPLEGITRNGIALPELADAAFSLSAGEISDPVESSLGWHLVQVNDIEAARTVPLEEAESSIRDELARIEASDMIFDVLNDVEDGLAGGATLEEVARDSALEMSKIENLTRNGLDASGNEAENTSATAEILARLFSMENTGNNELVESANGGFAVVRLDSVTAPAVPALEEIRARVVSAWKEERAREQADETAAALAERARNGEALETLASESGATYSMTEPFDRSGRGAALPRALIAPVFETAEGEIIEQPVTEGTAIARVAEIIAPDMESDEREQLSAAIRGQLASDIVNQLGEALRRDIEIDIDEDALRDAFVTQ